MRVPDYVLSCVAFVAEYLKADADEETYDHQAKGFFVILQSEVLPGMQYGLFVTAKHVARDL
jgi:hypothetical protein